ncbi:MAG: hypothetical protein GWN00_01945 [Aliifodinibius sp.]|nr:hypothetical protein [Fodinibius sp.]NIV10040.1 hypothetical protein [Fodinibius sp.]NIY23619.1 hypothetical protein [Fodinibius sp.]
MAVQYEDVKELRTRGQIGIVWNARQLEPYVDDHHINATLANHSACPCGKLTGYHCALNTMSHRFVRLGDGNYCLPEESPAICPMHSTKANLARNPYVKRKNVGTPNTYRQIRISENPKDKLRSIISNIKNAIRLKSLDHDFLSRCRRELQALGYEYNSNLYPRLSHTERFSVSVDDSPNNLAEALLWKLGKWNIYRKFVGYYENDRSMPTTSDFILYAFAKHLKNNSNAIVDQHTIRAMWAIDDSLTKEEIYACRKFLMNKKGQWRAGGSGKSGLICYHAYMKFVENLEKGGADIREYDRLLMPLGKALKDKAKNHEMFIRLFRTPESCF